MVERLSGGNSKGKL